MEQCVWTEPGAGSDVGLSKQTAPQEDERICCGEPRLISSGDSDLYENIVHLVLARTPNVARRHERSLLSFRSGN